MSVNSNSLLVFARSSDIIDAAQGTASLGRLTVCKTLDDVERTGRGGVSGAIVELGVWHKVSSEQLRDVVRSILAPILLVTAWEQRSVADLFGMCDGSIEIHDVIPPSDPAPAIRCFIKGQLPSSPLDIIFARIAKDVPSALSSFVAASVVLARCPSSTQEIADCCGISSRTLRSRCQRLGFPQPRDFLGWTRSLYEIWMVFEMGHNPKEAAHAGGFASADSMSHYIMTHTGASLRTWQKAGGFWSALDKFAASVSGPGAKS